MVIQAQGLRALITALVFNWEGKALSGEATTAVLKLSGRRRCLAKHAVKRMTDKHSAGEKPDGRPLD